MNTNQFDLIVIGAGPGGYVAALAAARGGMKVAVCERDTVGGTCLAHGCIPTKTLLHTAELYHQVLGSADRGLESAGLSVNMDKLQDEKNEVVQTLSDGIQSQFKRAKIALYTGEAQIIETGEVKTVRIGEECLQSPRVLIATGTEPVRLRLPGMDLDGVMDSTALLELREIPQSITIIGGGVIGMEFASLYAALGTKVTVIEALDRILATLDREFGQSLRLLLKKQGVDIHTGASLREIRREQTDDGEMLHCYYVEKDVEYKVPSDIVLVAVGRRPQAAKLFVNQNQLPDMDRGYLKADDRYQTSIPGIYAIGDVIGGIQLAHVASAEGENAVAAMLGKEAPFRMDVVPSCVYTDPEIATVGLAVEEAKASGIDAVQVKYVMGANGKTVLTHQERSFIKIVAEKSTGRLLGAHMMCARATDMIGEFSAAIANGFTVQQLATAIRPHPTFNEAIGEALRSFGE